MNTTPKREARTRIDSEEIEKIRQRAYELYLARGRGDGHDIEDWLPAEEEIAKENWPLAA